MPLDDPVGTQTGYMEPDDGEATDSRRRGLGVEIAAAVVLLLVLWWILTQTTVVPDVVGMSERDARAELRGAQLMPGDVTTVRTTRYRTGLIADQAPIEGRRVMKGTEIDLAIAVSRSTASTSEEPTSSDELDYTYTAEDDGSDGPEGQPAPRSYASANLGPQVPMVQALTESTAVSRLRRAGYRVTVKYGPTTTGPEKGRVFFQEPEPYAFEPAGTRVEIWVSTGGVSPGGFPYPRPEDPDY